MLCPFNTRSCGFWATPWLVNTMAAVGTQGWTDAQGADGPESCLDSLEKGNLWVGHTLKTTV